MDENKNGFEQSSISDSKDLPERLKILVKQLKRGIHNAEILDETLKKMSEQFHNSGSVLKKISEKSTAKTSRKNLHDYVDKDCMNTYSAINILGDNHLRISDEINELIESKYHTGLENLRLRCKTLDKQNGECVASLRKQRVNIELLKQRAIKKITNEFEKDYNIRTNGTPSKQRLSVMVRFEKIRKMRGKSDDSTTSECMRAYSIATESFNSYYKNYSDNFLPKAHKMYTAIENERKKLIEEALFKFPELFKAFNRNNENALQKQIVEKEESEESPTKTEKQSNKKDASTNDPFLYKLTEVLIDKDWHILQLKKKHNDIFDTTIECLLKFDQNKGKTVPIELTTVCEFVREHGKETEGIFRISALSKTTSRVKQLIKTKKYDLPEETDVHACACFIKQFLQQLPESVVNIRAAKKCYAIGEKHLNGANVDDCIKDFEQILKDIYPENIPTLEYVSKFLNEISLSKEKNRMNHENLGIIFAPTLLAMSEKTMEDISTKIRRGKFFMIFVIACANKIEWK